MELIKWWMIAGVLGVVLFMVVSRSVVKPLRWMWRGVMYSVIGGVVLLVVNWIGTFFGFAIAINPITVSITGVLGLPGLAYLIAVQFFLI
ncbi:pro-sigmaK processing inhibitor BofA family protein [Thermoactinomyces sp. DSM 45891]|uniref:pro-sigmaK processing inhibitor BofA family protein n=1 Tax=Thermoactinomyces sp. DSM 45891 TaxID=1761907 RepID=UPI0009F620AA|nr:pro-sigmaK processing inhibitor BofA family protein [Thermoactinomyces sp. DSM 45891]